MISKLTPKLQEMFKRRKKKIIIDKKEPSTNEQLAPYLETADYTGFFLHLNQMLWNRITELLKLAPSESTKHNIDQQLQLRNWNMQDRCILQQLLCECDYNLYTPIDENGIDLQPILREANEMLEKLL